MSKICRTFAPNFEKDYEQDEIHTTKCGDVGISF